MFVNAFMIQEKIVVWCNVTYLVRLGTLGVLGVVDAEVLAVRVERQHGADAVPRVEAQLGAAQRQLQHAREPARAALHAQVREHQRLVPATPTRCMTCANENIQR